MDHFMSDDVVYRKKNFCCECAAAAPSPKTTPTPLANPRRHSTAGLNPALLTALRVRRAPRAADKKSKCKITEPTSDKPLPKSKKGASAFMFMWA